LARARPCRAGPLLIFTHTAPAWAAVPEWTPAETLELVTEVMAIDDGRSRSVSVFQKWATPLPAVAARGGGACLWRRPSRPSWRYLLEGRAAEVLALPAAGGG